MSIVIVSITCGHSLLLDIGRDRVAMGEGEETKVPWQGVFMSCFKLYAIMGP